MHDVPAEMLMNIFSFLNQSDKAKSMLVCRKWYSIIQDSVLLNDITVYPKYFDTMIHMIENGNMDGAKVRKLTLENQDYSTPLHLKLCTAFPKTQKLVWHQPSWSSFSLPLPYLGKVNCKNESSSIEITGLKKCIHHLLQTTTFTKLTSLTLRLHKEKKIIATPLSENRMTDLFTMPLLEKIHLIGFSLDISQLERLHTLLPKLSNVNFSDANFENALGYYQPNRWIKSASAVKLFRVNGNSKIDDDSLMWIDYFSRKYTHIYEFEFVCHVPFCDDIQQGSDQVEACQIFHSKFLSHFTSHLKTYYVPNKFVDERMFNHLKNKNIQLKGLKFQYNNQGIISFQNSEQISSVQDLEITHCASNIVLEDIKSLRKLCLKCDLDNNRDHFYLDNIMLSHHLNFLEVKASRISLSRSAISPFSDIRHLILQTDLVDNNVWDCVSQYCPMLKNMELYLTSTITPDGVIMSIDLPTHSLDHLVLRVKDGCDFIKLITKNEIRWFELELRVSRLGKVKEIPDYEYEWLEAQYFASIRCRSIADFDIGIL